MYSTFSGSSQFLKVFIHNATSFFILTGTKTLITIVATLIKRLLSLQIAIYMGVLGENAL